MKKVVALKEIRLEAEEGTPFTAIREGKYSPLFFFIAPPSRPFNQSIIFSPD